jgi:hypothetical protein
VAIDRPRGILSPADRRYLENPEEYSPQAAHERERAIVERIHEALHDFPQIVSDLDEELLAEAFGDRDLEHKDHTLNVLRAAVAFLYLGVTDTVEPADLGKDAFEEMVEGGVKRAYLQRGDSVQNVTVNIEVETGPPLEEVLEQSELGLIELFQLIEAGEIPGDEAVEIMNEHLQERGGEIVNEEGRFQGAAARFPVEMLEPIFESGKEQGE